MNSSRRIFFLFVRRFLPTLALLCRAAMAGELPPAPASHIYDPDFLLTRKLTGEMTTAFAQFETQGRVTVYLAVFTATPRPIDETANDLNESWNQSGYGVLITFLPPRREARVLPSPQLSLVEDADRLSETFRAAARSALERGNYSEAASDGTSAILKELRDAQTRSAPPENPPSRLPRKLLLPILAALALAAGVFLWISARVWRSANLFGDSYRFQASTTPAALRFGAKQCGGQMATIDFRAPSKTKDV